MVPRRSPSDPDQPSQQRGPDLAARRLAQIAHGLAGGGDVPGWWEDHTVVAARDEEWTRPRSVVDVGPPPDGPPSSPPPIIPRPGRHAARRRVAPAWTRLPPLPVLRPGHVTVVALVAVVALALTTWWVARDRPTPAVETTPAAPGAAEELVALAGEPTTAEGDASATVTVDVAGKVRRPGIVVLDEGARVTDAVDAAGGARRGVDLTSLNLARVLVDGEQILVGAPAPASGPAGVGATGAGPASGPLVNLNLAGPTELEALPEVGPVTALAIVTWRDEHGGFTSIDELLEVDGIGPATLEKIAPHVTV